MQKAEKRREERSAVWELVKVRRVSLLEDEAVRRSRLLQLGSVLKRGVASLRATPNHGSGVDLIFLVDSSASVGQDNFHNELKFIKKLLADFTVSLNATRVAIVTFSSVDRVLAQVDHVSQPSSSNHKCKLLQDQLPRVSYQSGGTYTLGALMKGLDILQVLILLLLGFIAVAVVDDVTCVHTQ